MDILLIQLTSHKAAKLIQDLEDLQIIKILSQNPPKKKISDRFRGSLKLTAEEYGNIQQQLTEMRDEWERNIK